ncbi:glutamate racemase [Zhaonella formicivorans]|jgi:glutamate racemase|uniref:glutamate racemase n=1 Tax=Zhaonella formicivorans TaxID=2528593 RepID=UPI0010F2CD4A|nr:glutamate racemase [Zhaonella formicivorans]
MVVVGLFDSGVGGLTVARQVFQQLPAAHIIYYGDTARVPYGGKPVEELVYLADVITGFLIEQGAEVVIDACNSTSAVALEYLQTKYDVHVIGVIEPGVQAALNATKNGKIGLIATEATVKSGVHRRKLMEFAPKTTLFAQACPLFVPLIEAGEIDSPRVKAIAEEYLQPLQEAGIDTLILGCTHYPFLAPVLAEILGGEVQLVDPAVETVHRLLDVVPTPSGDGSNAEGKHLYYVSGDPGQFAKVGSMLLPGYTIDKVEKLVVG